MEVREYLDLRKLPRTFYRNARNTIFSSTFNSDEGYSEDAAEKQIIRMHEGDLIDNLIVILNKNIAN